MPQLKVYEQQVNSVGAQEGRRATAADFADGAQGLQAVGQGLEAVGQEVARRHEQSEVSDLTAKFAQTQADYSKKWRETLAKADPGDTTIAEKFVEDFDNHVGDMGNDISTPGAQKFYQRQTAQMKLHFTEKAVEGQSVLAGVKAKQDYLQTVGQLSSSLYDDPSSYAHSKELMQSGIEAQVQSGQMTREVALQLETQGRTELAKSALNGWARLDPENTKKDLLSGRWDKEIDGDLKRQMIGRADEEIRGREAEAARARAEQKRILEEQQQQTQNTFLEAMNKGQLTSRKVLDSNLSAFGSGSKEQFIQMLKTAAEKPPKTDPATFNRIFQAINKPDGDKDKLTDENDLNHYLGKGLTFEDIGRLRGEMQGKKTIQGRLEATVKNDFFNTYKSSITNSNPMLGKLDNIGDQKLYEFQYFIEQKVNQQRKEGKPVEALFNPNSDEFLGRYVSQYARTPQQQMADLRKNMYAPITQEGLAAPVNGLPQSPTPGLPPTQKVQKLPGESAADFLKRKKESK